MNYNIILNNEEIEIIFETRKKCKTLGDLIKELEKEFKDFDIMKSKKSQFIITWVVGTSGNIKNNPKSCICPNCSGKYVVRTYVGDLYYRLYNGTKKQRLAEKRKFENMGLFSNPWATGGDYIRDYLCLNCATRWNKNDEQIINEFYE